MAFDAGRLRVNGYLLPQETAAVRRSVALAEMRGVNDLDDNLTVDQLIAERLSIGSFSLWVSRSRVTPVRDELNHALEYACDVAGILADDVRGSTPLSSLGSLERKVLGVVLALTEDPRVVGGAPVDDHYDLDAACAFYTAAGAQVPPPGDAEHVTQP